MVASTIIARVADGLPLAASMDDEERLPSTSDTRCSVESGDFYFHYVIDAGVCYLVLCSKSFPKKLAFSYLDEIMQEFSSKYGTEVGSVARPYAFVKFDSFIQKCKKNYRDTRSGKLDRVNDELVDVARIMTRNISDVLGRGEALDRMSSMSSSLKEQSEKYRKDAKNLNLQAFYQKYGPVAVVGVLVLVVIYLRFFWW